MKIYIVDWQSYFGNGYNAPVLTNCRKCFKTLESAQGFLSDLYMQAKSLGTHVEPRVVEETLYD